MKTHMSAEERKSLIFEISMAVAFKKGLFKFTIGDVAKKSQCSRSTVKHYYGGIINLRNSIIEYGQIHRISWIIETPITDLLND